MSGADRQPGAGAFSSEKGTLVIASTAVAQTAVATATATFAGALVGDVVTVSPQANLNGTLGLTFARVVDVDTIVLGFSNVGASTNTGAATFDVEVNHNPPGADL